MTLIVPAKLAATCRKTPGRRAWLEAWPNAIRELQDKWSLSLKTPMDCDEVSCAWVALAICNGDRDVVLKLGMPHLEGEHESKALPFWQGNPTVRLLEADEELNAILERCVPETALRQLPESEQNVIIATLLRCIWHIPSAPHPFRPLRAMTAHWAGKTTADKEKWPDAGLVKKGLCLFEQLSRTSPNDVLLATDLHAGNVLRAQREPWLVILLEMNHERVRLWMVARSAAESRGIWDNSSMTLARVLP